MIEGANHMAENMFVANSADFERLREQGFTEAEAEKLIYMKEHVGEQVEYREMLAEQHRLDFMRWLVEHDRISK
jgi:hypothetical protein